MPDIKSETHPEYQLQVNNWRQLRDCYAGESQIKSKTTLYLPMTSSHILDGATTSISSLGFKAYRAYMVRALFKNFTRQSIQTALGMMHSQPANITLPESMKGIKSGRGETLVQLLRRINFEQLLTGRVGLFADIAINPPVGMDMPTLSTYTAERIINWDNGVVENHNPQSLNLVVLDETEYVREATFSWKEQDKYRVLSLGPVRSNEGVGIYAQTVVTDLNTFTEEGLRAPIYRGIALQQIPFVFINSQDIVAEVDEPPLLGLSNLDLAIYRGEADYRQNLFMQGQDTFVTIGGNFEEGSALRTGANSRIDLPTGGDAKYVGVTSQGLAEQRESLASLDSIAGSMGSQTLDTTSRERESGASLQIRVAARTCDLNQIADAGAAGLEAILKIVATWIGENPEEVRVVPNKEFGEAPLTGQAMVEISTAKSQGWPISLKTMHDLSLARRITKMSFDEETAQIELEVALLEKLLPKLEPKMNPKEEI